MRSADLISVNSNDNVWVNSISGNKLRLKGEVDVSVVHSYEIDTFSLRLGMGRWHDE